MNCAAEPYGRIAAWYDLLTARALKHARSRVTDLCRDANWRRVLDIGCGTGRQAMSLSAAGLRAVGLDASAAMLAVARKQLPRAVPLVRGGLPLPFAGRSFDACILSLILHETDEEPESLLREALRIAPACIVLEWRMPERNLDLPGQLLVHGIERLAGRRHYARFRSYAAGGWLRGLAARAGAPLQSESPLLAGTMTLAVLGG